MPFYDREEDKRRMKAVLSGEPNLVYFVYGPINSGKTALLMRVFEELPEEYRVFYINFRWRYVGEVRDLIQVLFRVKGKKEKLSVFLEKALKGGAKLFEKLGGIPIPEEVFDLLFRRTERAEDVFAFLKDYFSLVVEKGYKPVFVLDEMQTIKEVINTAGKPVIHELFNFLVGLTKETHLCHSLCATSDCLFIEDVYSNARLEGRAEYILVDDLSKEKAFEVYEEFGFREKERVWEYIGGKFGDMIRLYEKEKSGLEEGEALEELWRDEVGKLRMIEGDIFERYEEAEALWEYLGKFGEVWERPVSIRKEKKFMFFWVDKNILFYNPVRGTIRPQGRLIQRAIGEIVK